MIPCPPMNIRPKVRVRVVRQLSGRRELCTSINSVTRISLLMSKYADILLSSVYNFILINLWHCGKSGDGAINNAE